jgi:cytochrome c5
VTVAILAVAGYGYSRLQAAVSPPPPAQALAASPSDASPRVLLNEYCVTCHNQKLKTAGLMLDVADVQRVGAGAELWESVVKKIRSGAMPPPGRPTQRPSTHS